MVLPGYRTDCPELAKKNLYCPIFQERSIDVYILTVGIHLLTEKKNQNIFMQCHMNNIVIKIIDPSLKIDISRNSETVGIHLKSQNFFMQCHMNNIVIKIIDHSLKIDTSRNSS